MDPEPGLPAFKPRDALALSMPQREAVIERLTRSFAEDAITMDEFERRAELAYRAVSMADLQLLVSDLPAAHAPATSAHGTSAALAASGSRIFTMLGNTERRMTGVLPRFLAVRTLLGNTELDLSQSTFEPGVTEINVKCLLGNVALTVPHGVRVEMYCASVLASVGSDRAFDIDAPEIVPASDTPRERVLRITGRALLANVEVHRVSPRSER